MNDNSFTDAVAVLCGEPFNLSVAEVGSLTPFQVSNIYFRERDENGNVKLTAAVTTPVTPESAFRIGWELNGLSAHIIDRLWAEEQERRRGDEAREGS